MLSTYVGQVLEMELDQQKEGEAEQLSGTRDVSQHQALEQEKGRRTEFLV